MARRRLNRVPPNAVGAPGSYPPPLLEPHPQLRRRKVRWLPWALALAGLMAVAIVAVIINRSSHQGDGTPFAVSPYSPQVNRNFEVVGSADGPLTNEAVDLIAKNNSYEFLPKFANGYNIQAHFADARRLVEASKKYGTNLKVFDYFSSSYWFINNNQGWQPYSHAFQTSWLMHDSTGRLVPFVGGTAVASKERSTLGYLLDLSNPDYRDWAVSTVVAWMHAAPLAGINFDSSNPLQSDIRAKTLGNGSATFGNILCGNGSAGCSKLDAWNAGLTDLLTRATKAINDLGGQVRYNGIASTDLRGETRNIGLLKYTDMASNEAFCMGISVNQTSRLNFTSIKDDADLMQKIAAQGKIVTQVTSAYGTKERQQYGDYCFAGFMVGWQPGHSYFCFHDGYGRMPTAPYPLVPEQNLNLGRPLTIGYQQVGDEALTRRFQNGFVAVNPGTTPQRVTVPQDVRAFANGKPGETYKAGQSVELPARGALLALSVDFLEPDAAAK